MAEFGKRGGEAFFPASVTELEPVYRQVAAEVRTQYLVGYISTNAGSDGAWQKVDIKLKRTDAKRLRVRAHSGYYAAGPR